MVKGPTMTFKQYWERNIKGKKAMKDLEKFGKKLPSGGHVWTGADLIKYFDSLEKKKKRKRKKR